MLSLLTSLMSAALAGSTPTINLPSVAEVDDGVEVYVGSGAAILGFGPLPSARVAAQWQSGSLGLRASSTAYFGSQVERFDVLGVSWASLDGDRFRMGPVLTLAEHTGTSPIDHRVTARAGLGLDSGGERLRFDMTLSLVGAGWYPRGEVETPLYRLPVFDTLLVTELGLRRSWGAHQARLGLLGPMPTLGYQWSGERLRFRIDGSTMGTQHGLWVQIGRRL